MSYAAFLILKRADEKVAVRDSIFQACYGTTLPVWMLYLNNRGAQLHSQWLRLRQCGVISYSRGASMELLLSPTERLIRVKTKSTAIFTCSKISPL